MQPHKLPRGPIPLSGTRGRRHSLWATNRTWCLEKSNARRHFCLSVVIPRPSVTWLVRRWRTAGSVARECGASRDVLEMGLESQQELFRRVTLVSNSMGTVTRIFQDGLFLRCGQRMPAERPNTLIRHISVQMAAWQSKSRSRTLSLSPLMDPLTGPGLSLWTFPLKWI